MVKPVIFFCKFLKNQYSLRGFLMKLVKFSFLLTFDSCLQVSHCLLLINFLFEKKSLGNNWMLATVFEKDTHDHITLKGQCRFHMLHHPLLVIPENLWFSCVHFRVKNDIFWLKLLFSKSKLKNLTKSVYCITFKVDIFKFVSCFHLSNLRSSMQQFSY